MKTNAFSCCCTNSSLLLPKTHWNCVVNIRITVKHIFLLLRDRNLVHQLPEQDQTDCTVSTVEVAKPETMSCQVRTDTVKTQPPPPPSLLDWKPPPPSLLDWKPPPPSLLDWKPDILKMRPQNLPLSLPDAAASHASSLQPVGLQPCSQRTSTERAKKRQKQINKVKNSLSYCTYLQNVPM